MSAAAANHLPPRLLERLQDLVPPERLQAVAAQLTAAPQPVFRVNVLRTNDAEVLAELAAQDIHAEALVDIPHAYRVVHAQRPALVRSRPAGDGRIYVQGAASLLPALALDVAPGQKVLDLAAAPGGKTLHLAALLADAGDLRAVEVTRSRFFRLQRNLKLHGVTCCKTYLQDGRRVGELLPGEFDRVLLDAPCSGEAQLGGTADDDERPNWSEAKIQRCAGKQRQLLASAVQACKPGGVIVYCTCTTAPEENEAVLAHVLVQFGDELALEACPLPASAAATAQPGITNWRGAPYPASVTTARRILPSGLFGVFFLCRLRKQA